MRLMYFIGKTGESSYSAWIVEQMLFWDRWNRESTRRVFSNISRKKTRSHARHAAPSQKILLNTSTAARDDHVTGSVKALDGLFWQCDFSLSSLINRHVEEPSTSGGCPLQHVCFVLPIGLVMYSGEFFPFLCFYSLCVYICIWWTCMNKCSQLKEIGSLE